MLNYQRVMYIVTPKDANQVSFVTWKKIKFFHILSFWVSAVQQKLLFSRHRFNQNQLTMLLVWEKNPYGVGDEYPTTTALTTRVEHLHWRTAPHGGM